MIPLTSDSGLIDPLGGVLHEGSRTDSGVPARVVTPSQCWAYALSFKIEAPGDARLPDGASLAVELEVLKGRIGVGVTNRSEDAFIEEKFASDGASRVVLRLTPGARPGRLVFRNAAASDDASEFRILSVKTGRWEDARETYLVRVSRRDVKTEQRPVGGGTVVFDDQPARSINEARLRWLESVDLPVSGKRVLDAGSGVGHFVPYYVGHGCTVIAVDGRRENIDILRERHPGVEAHVMDVQRPELRNLGPVDVIHSFGLLYHLESPVAALRNFEAICGEMVILETMVCDSTRALAVLADETKTVNQALNGLGSRPSPSYIVLALNRAGFRHVYGTSQPPSHGDFQFEWRDNLDIRRDDHNLRCVFVASRTPISRPTLISLLDQ